MADNAKIPENTSSTVLATCDEVSYSGDTSKLQIVRSARVTGAEGAKTVIDHSYAAGVVDTGTQRFTLANDDPTVALQTAIAGTLTTISGSLSVIDDWDESDRCKTNPIVGQAGVAGGSGVVGATTQRVVLATDVALPAGDNNIGNIDVLTVPADPFGVNADVASATGSISAKLRFIASTGIPVTALPLQFNTGVITATTQRVTIATDDPILIQVALSLTNIEDAVGFLDNAVYIDNALWTDSTSSHFLIGGLYQSTPQSITDGRTGPISLDMLGRVRTADVNSGSIFSLLEAAIPIDRMQVNPIVGQNGVAAGSGAAGVTTQRIISATDDPCVTALQIIDDWDETDRCKVNPIVGQAGLQGGSGAVSANTLRMVLATDVALPAGTNTLGAVNGTVAHDSIDADNPQKIGAKATTSLSGLTLVANADRTNLFAGVDGVQITRPHCNLEDIVTGNASNTDGSSTQCIAAQAAGVKTYLTSIILTNTSASNIYVEIKDGTTVKVTIPVPANGGAIFNPPVPLPGTAATAWNFDASAATTTLYCSMIGFKSKI